MFQMRSASRLTVLLIVMGALVGLVCTPVVAAPSNSLYADHQAYKSGDVLTVIISENATANQQANTDVSQSNQANAGAGTGILDFIKSFGMNQSDSNSAAGTTSRSGNLSSEVTVQITEVLANGNFKISGIKEITINEEKQKVELTGIVRPEDITSQNTVDSTYVADVDIKYEGKGAIGDKQKPGIISSILDWLF